MSLALLLEKYDVSTEEGLQKALNEIEKEECDVDEALTAALSRAASLEGKLRTASQAYTKLGAVKADAQTAADMVEKTATLAQDVSAKVRQLDLARSRVAEVQRRVHDLIDLQLCSAGVEAALKAHDLETGAAHVARFLSMEEGSVAAARARGPDPRSAMAAAATTLRKHIADKFDEAARKGDEAGVEKLFRLFPQIGCAEEGVDLLSKYLAKQVDIEIRKSCKVADSAHETAYADAFTRVAECGAAAVRRVCSARVPGALPRALAHIQPAVCAGARRLFNEMSSVRQLGSTLGGKRAPPPLSVEAPLAELAVAHATVKMYFAFITRHAEADAASLKDEAKQKSIAAVNKILNESDLMRTAQDLLGHYLELERYFLEESVNKAIKMSSGTSTSSLVDDVFFIARKVIRRSLSTGSVDGACAVLNDAAALLERTVASTLRKNLRSAPPEPLPLAPPTAKGGPAAGALAMDLLGQRMNRDLDVQRQLFLAHMNEAEAGAEWSERLAAEACAEAEPLFKASVDREKLQSCAAGLGSAAAAFRAAHEVALQACRAGLKPRVLAWADELADPTGDAEEQDSEADALPGALEALLTSARSELSQATAEAVLLAVVTDLTARAEARMLAHTYDREGGIMVERRARRLASWAGGALGGGGGGGGGGGRERCARLSQAASLLALEQVSHAPDALTPPRLPPNRAKDILHRRSDFKIEDIKRLKL